MAKGQGLSVNAIIITALALIVLIVLIMVFTGRMTIFGAGLSGATEGEECKDSSFSVAVKTPGGTTKYCEVAGKPFSAACPRGYDLRPGTYEDMPAGTNKVCCSARPTTSEECNGVGKLQQ